MPCFPVAGLQLGGFDFDPWRHRVTTTHVGADDLNLYEAACGHLYYHGGTIEPFESFINYLVTLDAIFSSTHTVCPHLSIDNPASL